MTMRVNPLSYHQALNDVAARIGWLAVTVLCGITESEARDWSGWEADHSITMFDAERLDRAYMAAGGYEPPFLTLLSIRLNPPMDRS